jgi:hypothetical protein
VTSFDMTQGHTLPEQTPHVATDTSKPTQQATTTSEESGDLEIKAAKIGAKATKWAAGIGVLGSALTGFILFQVTQHYQGNDGRQKALNEYVNSMKELIASTDIDRTSTIKIAALAYSKTLLAMRELDGDGDRKGQALRFLHENCLATVGEKVLSTCETLQDIRGQEKFNLRGANLNGIVLEDTWIPNVNLRKVYMKGANLQNADLSGANLAEADITPNQRTVLWGTLQFPKGILEQNANLKKTKLNNADLTKANLKNVDLRQADLRFANLAGANLEGANLEGACYIKGTETTHFPKNFNPAEKGMVPMAGESNPEEMNTYKPCVSPPNS